jgi:hypothetical protein
MEVRYQLMESDRLGLDPLLFMTMEVVMDEVEKRLQVSLVVER